MSDQPLVDRVRPRHRRLRAGSARRWLSSSRASARIACWWRRTQGGLEETDDAIRAATGRSATLLPLDLQKDAEKQLDFVGPSIVERFGRLDILVHNAGALGKLTPVSHIEPKDWAEVVAVNLSAAWRLIRSCDPPLRASDAGRAVFVTTGRVLRPRAYWGMYGATKAGMEHLVQTWAQEVEKTRLRVNLFDPGVVATKMRAAAMPGEDPTTDHPAGSRSRRHRHALPAGETPARERVEFAAARTPSSPDRRRGWVGERRRPGARHKAPLTRLSPPAGERFGRGGGGSYRRGGRASGPGGEAALVFGPAFVAFAAESQQIVPGIDPAVVQVVEDEPHRVMADRLDLHDADMAPPGHDHPLAGPVPLHLGRGALDAEVFGRQRIGLAIVEGDVQHLLRAVQPDFGRRRHQPSLRASSGSMIGMPSRIG
jgi:NAD(P)-dependent dehydrogenase (short-subunit alcohol dehydrogenase family)